MLEVISHENLPTVLLIDDDMVSREVMATMMTMSGYAVHTAEDGAAALDLLDARRCRPTIILMDVQMPGVSGLALIEQLRARCAAQKIQARLYVISGSGTAEEIIAAADGFLMKPFPPESLTRLIAEQQAKAHPKSAEGLDPTEVVINQETLAQLRDMMPASALRQIFEAILADLDRRVIALKKAVARHDWEETRRIGHAIKGGSAMAGASQLARLGAAIEAGGLEVTVNQPDNSERILADLSAAAENLQRMLDVEFKN
jgi:CheY-like chemotaxis protein